MLKSHIDRIARRVFQSCVFDPVLKSCTPDARHRPWSDAMRLPFPEFGFLHWEIRIATTCRSPCQSAPSSRPLRIELCLFRSASSRWRSSSLTLSPTTLGVRGADEFLGFTQSSWSIWSDRQTDRRPWRSCMFVPGVDGPDGEMINHSTSTCTHTPLRTGRYCPASPDSSSSHSCMTGSWSCRHTMNPLILSLHG